MKTNEFKRNKFLMVAILLFLAVMLLSITVMPIAYAEGETTEETEETEEAEVSDWAQYWNDTIQPKMEMFVTTVVGVVVGLISMVLLVKKAIDLVKTTVVQLKAKETDVETKTEQLTLALSKLEALQTELSTYKTDLINATSTIAQLAQDMGCDMTKVKKALAIGFCNTKELVANGFAKEIAKEINDEQQS